MKSETCRLPFGTYSVDFVNEDNTWGMFFGYAEEFANELGTVTKILLNKLRTDHAQESCGRLVCDCLGKEGLSCSGNPVKDDALRRLDSHLLV